MQSTHDNAIGINEEQTAVNAIRKKLVGKKLTYKEIYAIMDEISKHKFGDVLITYFTASGYSKGFDNEELYHLTKAMVETGEKLHFDGIVADKHSIGGIPGTRTTLIVVPIVAAAGFLIPKSSSRAITTPGGTADDMEVLAPVTFEKEKIYSIIKKTNACIVWGGSFNIAPADDIIIKIEQPLRFESYDKILVSIMAKKVAFGSTHLVIDLPYGKYAKVHRLSDALLLQEKFDYLAERFHIKIRCLVHRIEQPFGRGIGPILETRESVRVLQQKSNRPIDLEMHSLRLAGNLLELCLSDAPQDLQNTIKVQFGNAHHWASHLLQTGKAFEKMKEIIQAQGGNPNIDSEDLQPGKYSYKLLANKHGKISHIHLQNLISIAKILGAPLQKGAGIFLHKKIGETLTKGALLCTLYSENMYNLKEAEQSLKNFPIFTI